MGLLLSLSNLLAPWCIPTDGDPKPYPMIYFLKKEHFEPMHAQMEHKEHSKISLKSISQLTDIPTYKSTTSMSKHICDFESYLSTHYGIEGSPLD